MQTSKTPVQLEMENPALCVYDCTGCCCVDPHGVHVCLRKILDEQAEPNEASLLAVCFDGHDATLLRSKRVHLP